MSQMYALWLAVLIKQIIKDPIRKLKGFIALYHVITAVCTLVFVVLIAISNQFGVEENLQCGVMHVKNFG